MFVGETRGLELWARPDAPMDGTYTVKDGATTIGTGSPVARMINGQPFYVVTIPTTASSFTTSGLRNLSISYSGNARFNSQTLVQPFMVFPVASTTLATSASPVGVNKPVTLRATLTPAVGQEIRGTNSDYAANPPVFKNGTTTLTGTPVLALYSPTRIEWTLAYTPTTSGNKTINVTYPRNVAAAASTAPAFTLTVMAAGGSATVVTGPASSSTGSAVTLRATVTGNAAAIPTGTVTFKDGSTTIAGCAAIALSTGAANCTTSALVKGAHSITAVYSGDSANATSTSVVFTHTVAGGTATTLTSSLIPVQVGSPITLRATVSPATATGNVHFLSGTTVLASGTLAAGVASATVSFPENAYVKAVYQGDANNHTSTSVEIFQRVAKMAPVISALPSLNPSPAGSGNIVFTFSNFYSSTQYAISVNGESYKYGELGVYRQNGMWDPLESTCRHASLSIL